MGKRGIVAVLFLILIAGFVSAAAVQEDLHVNIQALNSSDDIVTGTFTFGFNISMSSNCSDATNVVYANTSSLTTDSRGIVDYYIPNVTLNYSDQYWLCHYRDNTLINSTKIARTPYTFSARNVSAQGIINDSNINLVGYNMTASSGLFSFLGSLASRLTDLFVTNIDFTGMINGSGWINTTSNISASWFFGIANQSDTLDSYNSTYFMPLNTSVTGNFDFNGGWQSSGLSIIGGDIYARVGYFYNISSLEVNNLIINGSLIPIWDNNFDIGNASFMWRTIRTAIVNSSGVMYYNNGTVVNSTLFTIANTTANIRELLAGTNISQFAFDQVSGYAKNTTAEFQSRLNNTNMYFSSLGIGTSSPTHLLNVYGSTNLSGAVYMANSSFYINNSGFVGIKTKTPRYTLDVVQGGSDVYGNAVVVASRVGGDMAGFGLYNTNAGGVKAGWDISSIISAGTYRFNIHDLGGNERFVIVNGTGNVGIGTTEPTHLLNVFGNSNLSGDVSLGNNSMLFVNGSNVGIGTTAPKVALHVNGEGIRLSTWGGWGSTYSAGSQVFGSNIYVNPDDVVSRQVRSINTHASYGHSYMEFWNGDMAFNAEQTASTADAIVVPQTRMFIEGTNGNVGIGTSSPTHLLNVFGNSNLSGDVSLGNNSELFVDDSTGNVGIGTTSPLEVLNVVGNVHVNSALANTAGVEFDVEGNAECDGAGCWAVESDLSYKENVIDMNKYNLSTIMQIQTKEYDLKETGQHQFGLIGQDLKLIVPEIVYGEEGSYSIGYDGLTPILVKAIQEQQSMIESQNQTINNLQIENQNLNQELLTLKSELCLKDNSYSWC